MIGHVVASDLPHSRMRNHVPVIPYATRGIVATWAMVVTMTPLLNTHLVLIGCGEERGLHWAKGGGRDAGNEGAKEARGRVQRLGSIPASRLEPPLHARAFGRDDRYAHP